MTEKRILIFDSIPSRIHREEKHIMQRYRKVRAGFFPRWDQKKEWRICRIDPDGDDLGLCCRAEGSIAVVYDSDADRLDWALIHEINHARTGANSGHNERWENLTECSAQKALKMGRNTLFELLDDDWHNDWHNDRWEKLMRVSAQKALKMGRDTLFELINDDWQRKKNATSEKVYDRLKRAVPWFLPLWAYETALAGFISENNCGILPIFAERLRVAGLPGKSGSTPDLEGLLISDCHYFANYLQKPVSEVLKGIRKFKIADPINRVFDEVIHKLWRSFRLERFELISRFPEIPEIFWATIHQNLKN